MKLRFYQTYDKNGLNDTEELQYWNEEEGQWKDVPHIRGPECEYEDAMSNEYYTHY